MPPGTSLASTLDSTTGTLRFAASGTPVSPTRPFALQLVYSGGGPYNITDCTNFILGFSEFSGVGTLYIEVGSSDGFTDEHRVDLTGPGDVFYSVSDVKPNSIHTVDSFNILRFVFEARSTDFSFTLDEIRLIPEPGGGDAPAHRRHRISLPPAAEAGGRNRLAEEVWKTRPCASCQ